MVPGLISTCGFEQLTPTPSKVPSYALPTRCPVLSYATPSKVPYRMALRWLLQCAVLSDATPTRRAVLSTTRAYAHGVRS
eukprot:2416066-Rhodomonas_salina.2